MSGLWAVVGTVWDWAVFAAILAGGILLSAALRRRNARAAEAAAAQRRREQAIDGVIDNQAGNEGK